MVKNLLFYIFKDIQEENQTININDLTSKKYEDMTETQRSFYTVTLLLAEIEKQASENNLFIEQEISKDDLEKVIDETSKD